MLLAEVRKYRARPISPALGRASYMSGSSAWLVRCSLIGAALAGLAAAGYGFGAFFTSVPIDNMIEGSGYERTLLVWGSVRLRLALLRPRGLPAGRLRAGDAAPTQLLAQGNAAESDLLTAVHLRWDVHERAHGGLNRGPRRDRVQGRTGLGVRGGGAAAVTYAVALDCTTIYTLIDSRRVRMMHPGRNLP
jgi:hypothetical protein